jgi:hypothetical protein
MNIKELETKTDISVKSLNNILPSIGLSGIKNFTEEHIAQLERLKEIKASLPPDIDDDESTTIAIEKFIEERDRGHLVVSQGTHLAPSEVVAEAHEHVPPNVVEDLQNLAEDLTSKRLRKNAEGFIRGAVTRGYEITNNDEPQERLGSESMDMLMVQAQIRQLNNPEFAQESHDFFLEEIRRAENQ